MTDYERRLKILTLDKHTGLPVMDTSVIGVVPYGVLHETIFLFEDHQYDQSHEKVTFSVIALDLGTGRLFWKKQLIKATESSAYFSILKADSNYVWAYCDSRFWSFETECEVDTDSTTLKFLLLKTENGEVLKEKKIHLPNNNTFVVYKVENVLIVSEKEILILDGMSFQEIGKIGISAPITGLDSDQKMIYIGMKDKFYSAYNCKSEKLAWRSEVPLSLEKGYSPDILYFKENTFLDYWDSKSLFCFDTRENIPENKRIRWRFNMESVCPEAKISGGSTWHTMNDKLLIGLDNCNKFSYIILDRKTGKFLKGVGLPWIDRFHGEVIVSGNTIYCLTEDGVFYKVECF